MVKTTDFVCGTEPDRTNQLPSTLMELVLVSLWGHHRWWLKEEMFVKKKRIIPWIALPSTHVCDPFLLLIIQVCFC